ncbi:MAG: DinB family protein [Chloroflexi bacterium]|nr:MAG: DinB family protein [Chloroflexota bacterium]MBL1195643.1 DinB family protein [Chloroflexota bacterium]NOH12931.1 DinB family protein [Chloroflexota bacterium]
MNDKELRQQLANLLTARQAHMDFEDAVANFPEKDINTTPPNCEYTFWHLIEHLRLTQRDILEYITEDDYEWPTEHGLMWPAQDATTDLAGWRKSIDDFIADRQTLLEMIQNPATDLFAPLPNSGDYQHNILREINVIAAHNAYHTGELGILRQVVGNWNR